MARVVQQGNDSRQSTLQDVLDYDPEAMKNADGTALLSAEEHIDNHLLFVLEYHFKSHPVDPA